MKIRTLYLTLGIGGAALAVYLLASSKKTAAGLPAAKTPATTAAPSADDKYAIRRQMALAKKKALQDLAQAEIMKAALLSASALTGQGGAPTSPPLQPPISTAPTGVVRSPTGSTDMQWGSGGNRHLIIANDTPVRILQVLNNNLLVIEIIGREGDFGSQGTVLASDIQRTT